LRRKSQDPPPSGTAEAATLLDLRGKLHSCMKCNACSMPRRSRCLKTPRPLADDLHTDGLRAAKLRTLELDDTCITPIVPLCRSPTTALSLNRLRRGPHHRALGHVDMRLFQQHRHQRVLVAKAMVTFNGRNGKTIIAQNMFKASGVNTILAWDTFIKQSGKRNITPCELTVIVPSVEITIAEQRMTVIGGTVLFSHRWCTITSRQEAGNSGTQSVPHILKKKMITQVPNPLVRGQNISRIQPS
jgi:hypothetical protein